MLKHKQITDVSWAGKTLYAESVPHFLHWDLAYFWMLEKSIEGESGHVPADWQQRLDAWRHLLDLFFLGKVNIEEELFRKPFSGIAEQHGLTSVSWLMHDSEPIGVLSPTVLVRPLPDFREDNRSNWPERPSSDSSLPHFARLAIEDLENASSEFASTLARMLRDIFDLSTSSTSATKGRSVQIPILKQLQWSQSGQTVGHLGVLVQGGQSEPTMVPRCPNEGAPLLREENDSAIEVGHNDGVVSLPCPHEECRDDEHEFDLADFFIWQRSDRPDPSVVVWNWRKSREVMKRPEAGFPPSDPVIRGARVQFEWNEATLGVGEDRSRRYLEVKFPDHEVEEKQLRDVLYDSLLVPGEMKAFRGYPVRQEWYDVLKNTDAVIDVTPERDRVKYQDLQLRGWPMPISLTFDGRRIATRPEIGIGRYPHPETVPVTWNWFRFFASGGERKSFRVTVPDGEDLLPWMADAHDGLPEFFSVEESEDSGALSSSARVGVTYPAGAADASGTGVQRHAKGDGQVHMGVDFGTTNTVLYSFHAGQGRTSIDAGNNGIDPDQAANLIDWFAPETGAEVKQEHIADFLPRPEMRETGTDPYVIPSAVWRFGEHALIRWGQDQPRPSARPVTDFKIDRNKGPTFRDVRRAYLVELLSTYIPIALDRAYEQLGTGAVGTVCMGFAFPLALGANQREDMGRLLQEVQARLEERTGLDFDLWSLSESRACIQAFGEFKSGHTHLIADMGGGTMDVALLETTPSKEYTVHQIGSLRYAGESFLDVMTAVDANVNKWEIRDSVRSGQSQQRYSNNRKVETLVDAFMKLALEYLRHMGEADEKQRDTDFPELILVGNGWHLIEAFSEEAAQIGRRQYFDQQYNALLEDMGGKDRLRPTESFDDIPSSKHVVVIGALKNAINEGRHELRPSSGEGAELSKLPAGRGVKISGPDFSLEVPWHQLVGDGVPLSDDLRESQFERADIDFDFENKAPISRRWHERLSDIFDSDGLPYPEPHELREEIASTFSRQRVHLTKGPLQIILEEHWVERLKKL